MGGLQGLAAGISEFGRMISETSQKTRQTQARERAAALNERILQQEVEEADRKQQNLEYARTQMKTLAETAPPEMKSLLPSLLMQAVIDPEGAIKTYNATLEKWQEAKSEREDMVSALEKAGFQRKDILEAWYGLSSLQPKTLDQAWLAAITKENQGQPPTTEQIEKHYKTQRQNAIDALIAAGIDAQQGGDTQRAKDIFGLASQAAGARKGPPGAGGGILGVIHRANQGDEEAQADLKTWRDINTELAMARGKGYAVGRSMFTLSAYTDETGQIFPLSAFDAIQQIRAGKTLIPVGRLSANTEIAIQQVVSEALRPGPGGEPSALEGVRQNLKAFDNAGDRAILARIQGAAGLPAYGAEVTWFGRVLDQALAANLSPEGRLLVTRLRRLNETMGRLRGVLGLPATETAMALTISLLPGAATPDSRMAADQLNMLELIIKQAVTIPAFGGGKIAGQQGQTGAAAAGPQKQIPVGTKAKTKNGKDIVWDGKGWVLQ